MFHARHSLHNRTRRVVGLGRVAFAGLMMESQRSGADFGRRVT